METFSALLAFCARDSLVTGEFPSQRPVTRSFDVSFDLCLIKRLSQQSWGWWYETPSRPLLRRGNDIRISDRRHLHEDSLHKGSVIQSLDVASVLNIIKPK